MALTAEQLYQASQITPDHLGVDIIDPQLDDEAQRAAAIAWVGANVLAGARAEVSVPFRRVTGYGTVETFAATVLADLSNDVRDELVAEGTALYDLAVKSYGRSEINKLVASDAESYDKDSDQDRIQGNQRLEKLLEWARVAVDGATTTETGTAPSVPRSSAAHIRTDNRWPGRRTVSHW